MNFKLGERFTNWTTKSYNNILALGFKNIETQL
jgi:hypothetical protein